MSGSPTHALYELVGGPYDGDYILAHLAQTVVPVITNGQPQGSYFRLIRRRYHDSSISFEVEFSWVPCEPSPDSSEA